MGGDAQPAHQEDGLLVLILHAQRRQHAKKNTSHHAHRCSQPCKQLSASHGYSQPAHAHLASVHYIAPHAAVGTKKAAHGLLVQHATLRGRIACSCSCTGLPGHSMHALLEYRSYFCCVVSPAALLSSEV